MFCSIFNYKQRKIITWKSKWNFIFSNLNLPSNLQESLLCTFAWAEGIQLPLLFRCNSKYEILVIFTSNKWYLTKCDVSHSKLRPVVAGYKIDNRIFLAGSIINTARADMGNPVWLSTSAGSNIPNNVASFLAWSSIIGYGNSSPVTSP